MRDSFCKLHNLLFTWIIFGASAFASQSYSTETKGLPPTQQSQWVHLNDGDKFTLIASITKQKIGSQTIRRYAYNGTIPGPMIEVTQGAKIKIHFVNKTDSDQTIHPHGLRLNYLYDGIPGISQKTAVKPGESFDYELSFPDAGIFWYHPHVREDYTQNMGLYGNFLVRPKNPATEASVNKEVVLTLDDILLDKEAAPFFKDYTNYATMGRFGNVMLLNGIDKFKVSAHQGEILRFYLTNTANTRTFNFKIPNAKMKLIASDAGNFEHEAWQEAVIIAPAERYVVDVLFEKPGEYQIINAIPHAPNVLGKIIIDNIKTKISHFKNFQILHNNNQMSALRPNVADYLQKKNDYHLALTIHMPPMKDMDEDDNHSNKIEWEDTMPDMSADMSSDDVHWILQDTDKHQDNMDIHWQLKNGRFYKIAIFNDPKSQHPMQHPIHFHGQRFIILDVNGKKNDNYVWKDTVLVQRGDTVHILLEASNPGKWMAHCHISEHLSSSMMFPFDVLP